MINLVASTSDVHGSFLFIYKFFTAEISPDSTGYSEVTT